MFQYENYGYNNVVQMFSVGKAKTFRPIWYLYKEEESFETKAWHSIRIIFI